MEKTGYNMDISPPAYDDETVPAGAAANPQPILFTFSDHKDKTVSRPHVVNMIIEIIIKLQRGDLETYMCILIAERLYSGSKFTQINSSRQDKPNTCAKKTWIAAVINWIFECMATTKRFFMFPTLFHLKNCV